MVNRWGNNGNSDKLYFLGLQNHCGQLLQPWNWKMLLGRKAMTNLDMVLKQRHHLANKGPHSQSYGFPSSHVQMWESRTIKKAECWRTDVFPLWCWRRLLRIPWTARRSNQSILKEINPEYLLDGLMLKLQYFGHLMQRTNPWERTLVLGKIEDRRRRGW